jgi:galactose mutarotase-like enzyme
MSSSAGEVVQIASGDLRATIARRGAELVALEYGGQPLLWHGDPRIWNRSAPILFPVIGRSPEGRVSVGGRSYTMPAHGFARDRVFHMSAADGRSACFNLDADADTLAIYPFRFCLKIETAAERAKLTFAASIENKDEQPMPFGFGYHPGFLWPADRRERARYVLRFEAKEDGRIRRADLETGLMLPAPVASPLRGRTLAVDDDLFEQGSIQFEQVRSRSLWFGPAGAAGLRIAFPDSPQLGVWTKPGAPFLCLEPWQGLAAELNASPELASRPGMRMLAPGEVATYRMTIEIGVQDPQATQV